MVIWYNIFRSYYRRISGILQFTVCYVQTRPGYMIFDTLAIVVTRPKLSFSYILRSFLVSIFTGL
jgi:hypothetical protein